VNDDELILDDFNAQLRELKRDMEQDSD